MSFVKESYFQAMQAERGDKLRMVLGIKGG